VTEILTLDQKMLRETENALGLAAFPHLEGELQQELIQAEQDDGRDGDALARLIALAHAAHAVANAGFNPSFGPWYRDMGQRLLRRAMEVMAAISASVEPKGDGRLN
jgi:hypothetical protein